MKRASLPLLALLAALPPGTAAAQATGPALVAAATAALQPWLAERSTRHSLTPVQTPPPLAAPGGALRLQARPLDGATLQSRMRVWVDVQVDGRRVRSVPVDFDVRAWASAPVAAAHLPAGTPLHAADWALRELDLAAQAAAPADAAQLVAPGRWRTRRTLHEGQVLARHDLEALPAVVRGQPATLQAQAGAVRLESRVLVLQDGQPGDKVPVRQSGAVDALVARVVGPGRLEVAP